MTQTNDRSPEFEDDLLPEYDLSNLGRGIRGNYAEAMRQGYSITVHHDDGTSTTRYVPPQGSMNNDSMSEGKTYNWQGDRVNGDKVMGDKVGGDKVIGDKITNYNSQNLAQAAKEIKDLLNQLDQDYDRTTPSGQAMISAKAIEAIEQNPTLKARVVNALKQGSTTALEELVDHPAVKPVVALLKGFMDAK
jgi:hypothetical protein